LALWQGWPGNQPASSSSRQASIVLASNQTEKQFHPWLSGEAGVESLKPAPNDFLQKLPVSKRVNSSRADDNDPTLIEEVELATA
jgi:putative SOS response-associated peptidase YedK